jgi:hypothetical protein
MGFLIDIVLVVVAGYFTHREYEDGRYGWAIFWAVLLGWDIHSLLVNL